MFKKICTVLISCLIVVLSACDSSSDHMAKPQKMIITDVENVAWMREKLPANTLAYFRIPNIWHMFFEAKAGVLHQVQKQEEHINLINNIKSGVLDTYSEFIPQQAQLPLKTLLNHMSSPLEVAALIDANGSMTPNIMLATTFKNMKVEGINAFFNNIIQTIGPELQLISPFNAQGQGKLQAAMVPIFASFDDKTGQLLLLAGLSASQAELDIILAQKQHAAELDEVMAFEDSVDQAGKNLEFWLNIQQIYQHNKSFIPPTMMPMLTQFGLDQVEYVWAGTATKNGKSELITRLAMPEVGVRQLMPRVDSQIDLMTAGEPQSVWQFAIPTVDQIQQGFNWALSFDDDPEKTKKMASDLIAKINEFLGMTITEVFQAYGQKLIIVSDEAGTWFASPIKDKVLHNKVMQKITKAFKAKKRLRKLAGIDINHISYTTQAFDEVLMPGDDEMVGLYKLLYTPQSAYYQIEGDYFIQAFTPQVLADRANSTNQIKLSQWLTNQQSLNWDQAIFAYGKEVIYAPRDIYHFYLSVLNVLGYLTNVEVDLFEFPTAQQLNLPEKGRYGFAMESSADALSLKLSYEYSVLENMSLVDGYLTMAVVGIVAAYAVPAYRDYTVRAEVNKKLSMISHDKNMIAQYYAENQSFPAQEDLLSSIILQTGHESDNYAYNSENGEITVYFTEQDAAELNGKNIVFTPNIVSEGYMSWDCDGTVDYKHFKYQCY